MKLFLEAILLGIVEGITEFLPISSTGHLILLNQLIHFPEDFAKLFDIVIQLGAILSVVVYFFHELYPFSSQIAVERRQEIFKLWKKTIVAVIPAIGIGGIFGSEIKARLFNPAVVAMALFAGGILLIWVERTRQEGVITSLKTLSYPTAVAIGLIQCLAMIPGTSRSAATIIGAMLLGASRPVAAEFSFFLAIPTMFAASGYSLLKSGMHLSLLQWELLGVGFLVSFLVAWAVIAMFMNYIRRHDFQAFGYYRLILAIVVVTYFYGIRT
jgi:undecaprenyl-diphosphatase